MRRRLFVVLGLVITVSVLATFGIMLMMIHQSVGAMPWERANRVLKQQFTREWHDLGRRSQLAKDIHEGFLVTVVLTDVDGHVLQREGSGDVRDGHRLSIIEADKPIGYVWVHDVSWRKPITLSIGLLIFLSLLWLASGRLSRRMVQPLEHLADVARDIGDGQLNRRARLGYRARGEVGHLAHSINDMAARIEQQLAAQRTLLAAVSHELRTPLGHLRILLELAEDDSNPAKRHAEMQEELVEMNALVGELLASSRLDFTELQCRLESPVALATRALERAGLPAERLHVQGEIPDTVEVDPTLWGRALANLLDNARKHGGGVEQLVVVVADSREVCFQVEDQGDGFDPRIREQLFAPFVDGGSARSALGLGLHLVRRIAQAHSGRAFAHNRDGSGACFGITVPLAGASG